MKCYFCDLEARAVCRECGRASCKEHGTVTVNYGHVSAEFAFVCLDCQTAWHKPGIAIPSQ